MRKDGLASVLWRSPSLRLQLRHRLLASSADTWPPTLDPSAFTIDSSAFQADLLILAKNTTVSSSSWTESFSVQKPCLCSLLHPALWVTILSQSYNLLYICIPCDNLFI